MLGLVVLSALPLTLARLLSFESSNPYTFDGYFETTVPWTLAIVVPLSLAVLLMALQSRLPGAGHSPSASFWEQAWS